MSSAELESKKIVLAKKKEVLAEAFDSALDGLVKAPSDVKLRQYKAMVESAKKIIENPTALMSQNDKFTEVDMQYETLLQTIWDRDVKAVSDILFG